MSMLTGDAPVHRIRCRDCHLELVSSFARSRAGLLSRPARNDIRVHVWLQYPQKNTSVTYTQTHESSQRCVRISNQGTQRTTGACPTCEAHPLSTESSHRCVRISPYQIDPPPLHKLVVTGKGRVRPTLCRCNFPPWQTNVRYWTPHNRQINEATPF
jgi:hypothetical protein